MSFFCEILGKSPITEVEASAIGVYQLAYLGDSLLDLYIRTNVVFDTNAKMNKVHNMCINYVSAKAQSQAIDLISDKLSENEIAIYKRGRNAKNLTVPKNTSAKDHNASTGVEMLLGFLFVTGNEKRLIEIMEMIMSAIENI